MDTSGPKQHRAGILQFRNGEWTHHHQPGRAPRDRDDSNPVTLLPATQRPEPTGKFLCLGESADGKIWAGRNVLVFQDGRQWSGFVNTNTAHGIIEAMLTTRERELWLGTRQYGALRYDGHEWRQSQGKGRLVANSVRSLAQTVDGSIWAAKGGRITISTSLAELDEAGVTANPERRPGRFVCLAVSDTGCGMDEATLKRVFEPFFTTKEAGKGTGLGLATVHGIVAQHKGWVEVESAVGQGTTFRVFLPALARREAVAAADSEPEPVRRGRETILLVEDDTKVRQMIGQALRVLGYRVYEAANGQEAMALWQTHGPQVNLLLTDMVMPEGMTGLELTERLQALRPGLKAIISSGYSAEIVQAGVPTAAGVVYLPKPYEAKTLADVVRNCLDGKSCVPIKSTSFWWMTTR